MVASLAASAARRSARALEERPKGVAFACCVGGMPGAPSCSASRLRRRIGGAMIGYKQGVRDTLTRYGLIRRSPPSFFAVFAFGAGIGLVAGAAAAVLMTPSSGRDIS